MSKLSWGKPRLFVKDLDTANSPWVELATPVQDSTELQPTKGDKMEAPIEGGQNEDVKYKRSTYALVYNIRKAKGRTIPFGTIDGVCEHRFAFMLMPEDETNIGIYLGETTVTIDDTFTAADGAIWAIQHDAIAPASGNTVKWGTVAIAGSTITFTETQPASGASAVTVSGTVTALNETPTFVAITSSLPENPKIAQVYECIIDEPTAAQLALPSNFRLTWDTEPITGKTYYNLSRP